MSKPLGYYHLNYEHQLIQDIADTWGDNLEKLTEPDRYWLIATMADFCFCELGEDESDASREVYERTIYDRELDRTEKDCLILALGNLSRGQPLGFWGMPPSSLNTPLIKDIRDTWGETLQNISEVDQHYLITKLARNIWFQDYHEQHDTPAALEELSNRCDELPQGQIYWFLRALINK